MPIDAVLLDWGGTLARTDGEAQALRQGAARVLELLAGGSTPELVERMVGFAVEAERKAAADPEHREVNLRELIRSWAQRHDLIGAKKNVPDRRDEYREAASGSGRDSPSDSNPGL